MELSELPEDLIEEILRTQSLKDTLKSKCVCRRWEAIISNSTFLQYCRRLQSQSSSNKRQSNPITLLACSSQGPTGKHGEITGKGLLYLSKSNNINKSTLLDRDSLKNLKLVLYDKIELSDHVSVTSSSILELVLLIMNKVEPPYLHNPSTEELFALPTNPEWDHYTLDTMGLGRVDSTNEDKVMCAFYKRHKSYNGCNHCEVLILSSDDHWSTVPCFYEMAYEPSGFVGGDVYMLLSVSDCDKCKVRFDIKGEDWTVITPPEGLFTSWIYVCSLSIREVNGSLCLTIHSRFCADIWCLKDYKGFGF